jgi:hypothetical protein
MKIRFYASGKAYDHSIANAIMQGLEVCGEKDVRTVGNDTYDPDVDIAIIVGVKNSHIMDRHSSEGKQVVYIDKPYDRSQISYRVSFNGHQPTNYLMKTDRDSKRLQMFKWLPDGFTGWQYRSSVAEILLAGSSAKYHQMKELTHPTEYATGLVEEIKSLGCTRGIVYRPKPSWRDATDIAKTRRSTEKRIANELDNSFVLVTYGSNACFDALICGVPSIVLGDGVTRDISSCSIRDIDRPYKASTSEVLQLLCNLAYCQWTYDELQNGKFWRFVRTELDVGDK